MRKTGTSRGAVIPSRILSRDDGEHRDLDVVADHDALVGLAGEDQHLASVRVAAGRSPIAAWSRQGSRCIRRAPPTTARPAGVGTLRAFDRLAAANGPQTDAITAEPGPRLGAPGPHRRLDRPPTGRLGLGAARLHPPQRPLRRRGRRRRRRPPRRDRGRDRGDDGGRGGGGGRGRGRGGRGGRGRGRGGGQEGEGEAAGRREDGGDGDGDAGEGRRRQAASQAQAPRPEARRRRPRGDLRPRRRRGLRALARPGRRLPTRSTPSTGRATASVEVTIEPDQIIIRRTD